MSKKNCVIARVAPGALLGPVDAMHNVFRYYWPIATAESFQPLKEGLHAYYVQQLLVRSLIGIFWTTPYTEELVKWGTRLHDEFMLQHFNSQDLREVMFDPES